jgi:hypothetical protein
MTKFQRFLWMWYLLLYYSIGVIFNFHALPFFYCNPHMVFACFLFFLDVDLCIGSLSVIGKILSWDWGPNPFQVDWCKGTYRFCAHVYALVCKQMHIKVFEVCYLYLQTSWFWLWRFLDFNSMFACLLFSICHGVDVIPTLTYEVVY